MKYERLTREQLRAGADSCVIKMLREFYSEIPSLANLSDEDIRKFDEYQTWMNVFYSGASFGIDSLQIKK